MSKDRFDLIVIGGGINGAGIAADASGRNLKVALFEEKDFASATSSASTKLIHGGLRYLEQYQFRLVKEALKEREILLRKAPFLVWPMAFCLPYNANIRPAWLIRLGLFIYDHLSKRNFLPKSKYIRFDQSSPLHAHLTQGFIYFDCWVDDARLVITNLLSAKENGATVKNRHKFIHAKREKDYWHIEIKDEIKNKTHVYQSKALVNATGPWVQQVLENKINLLSPQKVKLIKGSHIVIKPTKPLSQAYILQNDDKRVIFVIPYLKQFVMLGTTDKYYQGSVRNLSIDEDEKDYLIAVYNANFKQQITKNDILHSFSGVRPLYTDDDSISPQSITRDYKIELNMQNDLPLISVFGGKLTTYRKLSENVVNRLSGFFPHILQPWTAFSPLPGGEGIASFQDIEQILINTFSLDKFTAHRLATSYGSRVWDWLKSAQDVKNEFGCGLSRQEVDYLICHEWVKTADDLLWRRTKLGMFLSKEEQNKLKGYIKQVLIDRDIE